MKASSISTSVSAPTIVRAATTGVLGRIGAGVQSLLEALRRWQMRRSTAAALEHLSARELRDIGLVRLIDVSPVRYVHISN